MPRQAAAWVIESGHADLDDDRYGRLAAARIAINEAELDDRLP